MNSSVKTSVHDSLSYCSSNADVNFISRTIKDYIDHMAQHNPNHVAYIFNQNSGLEITYSDLKEKVYLLANNFLRLNLKKGDRIAFLLPNTYELFISMLAASIVGIISVPFDPIDGVKNLEYMIEKTTPSAFIMYDSSDYKQMVFDFFPELLDSSRTEYESKRFPSIKHLIAVNEHGKDFSKEINLKIVHTYKDLSSKPLNEEKIEFPIVQADDIHSICFTTGTTSKPKGVIRTQFGLLNALHIGISLSKDDNQTIICVSTLLYHLAAMYMSLFPLATTKVTVVFPATQQQVTDMLSAIQKYKCDVFFVYPKTLLDLIDHKNFPQHDLSSLKMITLVGQHVSGKYIQRIKTELPSLFAIGIGYGMTEILGLTSSRLFLKNFSLENFSNNVGKPLPYMECKIVDPKTGLIQPLNTPGECLVRGFSVTGGYWKDEVQTNEVLDYNGWFKTGDIMFMDKDGVLYYKSRVKDVIKLDDNKETYPSDIEETLLDHVGISEAVAFSIQDKSNKHIVCAWVKLISKDSKITEKEIIEFCKGKLKEEEAPKYIKIVDELPLAAMAKYKRYEMRNITTEELIK